MIYEKPDLSIIEIEAEALSATSVGSAGEDSKYLDWPI